MATGRRRAGALALALMLAGPVVPAAAQAPAAASSFLFINQERLLTGSKQGQALLADEERQRDTLRNEARKLDSAFEEEERRLTEQRPTLPPEEFRKLERCVRRAGGQGAPRPGRAGERAGAAV